RPSGALPSSSRTASAIPRLRSGCSSLAARSRRTCGPCTASSISRRVPPFPRRWDEISRSLIDAKRLRRGHDRRMTLIETQTEVPRLGFATLCDAFQATVDANPDRVALRVLGATDALTWSQFDERVRRIAAGLAAIGTTRGDVVALLLTQRLEAP